MGRTEAGLYEAIEAEMKKAAQPLSCVELFEKASIRKHATSVNRVSDYLGNMWRRGDLTRLPAPKLGDTRSRWLYVWKGRKTVLPTMDDATDYLDKKMILQKPSVEISESGSTITIEVANLVIRIQQK